MARIIPKNVKENSNCIKRNHANNVVVMAKLINKKERLFLNVNNDLYTTTIPAMKGITLTKKDGAIKESVIKLNYIFTISEKMVKKVLFSLSNEKKKIIVNEFIKKLSV